MKKKVSQVNPSHLSAQSKQNVLALNVFPLKYFYFIKYCALEILNNLVKI